MNYKKHPGANLVKDKVVFSEQVLQNLAEILVR